MNSLEVSVALEGNAVRVVNDRFQTSLETFRHPETGSRIDLAAIIHAADAEYYQEIDRLTAAREAGGMILQSEKIMPVPEAAAAAYPALATLHALHMELREANRREASRIGLVPQIDHLRIGEVHDVTFDQHVKNKGPYARQNYESRLIRERTFTSQFNLSERQIHDQGLLLIAGLTRQDIFGSGQNYDAELIRETKQFDAIKETLQEDPGSSFILHWGAAHIPGFRDSCQELGYQLEDQRWITSQSLILG